MKNFYFFTFLFFAITVVNAQSAKKKYIIVKDSISQKAIPFAPLNILDNDKQYLLKTDSAGIIPLDILGNKRSVLVKAELNDYKPLILLWDFERTDTLIIRLQSKLHRLDEVTVRATSSLSIKQSAKGMTLNLVKEKNAKFWQLWEAIKQLPGVQVDESTMEVKYMGSKVLFKVNGLPSKLIASSLQTSMRMPASRFHSLDLEYYDPKEEGAMPVINLVLLSTQQDGSGGAVNSNIYQNMQGINLPLFWVKKKRLIEIIPSFSRMSMPEMKINVENNFTQQVVNLQNKNSFKSVNRNYSILLHNNYQWGKNMIDVEAGFSKGFSEGNGETEQQETRNNEWYRTVNAINEQNTNSPIYSARLAYVYKPKENSKWNLTVDYQNKENEGNNLLKSLVSGPPLDFFNYDKKTVSKQDNFYAQLCYEYRNDTWGELESGFKYFVRNSTDSYNYEFLANADNRPSISSFLTINNYDYAAMFVTWSKRFKRYSYFISMKGDHSLNTLTTPDSKNYSFFTYAPYMSIQRQINKNGTQNITLTIGYNQVRPAADIMNPIADIQTGNFIRTGNDQLTPERKWEIKSMYNATFKSFSLSAQVNASKIVNAISQFRTVQSDSIIVTGYNNLSSINKLGGLLTLTFRPVSKLSINGSIKSELFQFYSEGTRSKRYPYDTELGLRYNLGKFLLVKSTVNYTKSSYFQGESKGVLSTNLSLSYAKNNLNLIFNVSNFHNPYRNQFSNGWALGVNSIINSHTRILNIGLSCNYSFGLKATGGTKGKSIIKDDISSND